MEIWRLSESSKRFCFGSSFPSTTRTYFVLFASPDWQRQLSKFASVQDRLREWNPDVMKKITTFSCMAIKALDIDAIRIDKATQLTVEGLAAWTSQTRACAYGLGKENFFITGEVTGGNTFGTLYQFVFCLSL